MCVCVCVSVCECVCVCEGPVNLEILCDLNLVLVSFLQVKTKAGSTVALWLALHSNILC